MCVLDKTMSFAIIGFLEVKQFTHNYPYILISYWLQDFFPWVQIYEYHFCGIIIMKDTDKRIKVCFCCQKIQNFQASLHCFMQNLNIYNFMNFSSQNNHTEMIFICTERSFCPLSIMVKQNIVRHLVLEILIDLSVAFFFTQSL